LILKGESPADCIFEVTANEPAIFVDTKGKGRVTIEGITVKWQLATSDKNIEYQYAVAVKDSKAEVRNCNFLPLGNFKRCPEAIRADGFSELLIENCRFDGFEYTVCYGEGTEGAIQDCVREYRSMKTPMSVSKEISSPARSITASAARVERCL
jgi:hypothetical protein